MRIIAARRRGASLMEVLVSMLIMVIGVTSVIALFPVGVLRVRQAVLDTRCTIASQNAKNLIVAKQMPNDPALIRLDRNVDASHAGSVPADLDHPETNAFAWPANLSGLPSRACGYLLGVDGQFLSAPPANTLTAFTPSDDQYLSFPVLVDPQLFEAIAAEAGGNVAQAFNNAYIPISANYRTPPYHDLRVASLAEIHGSLPVGSVTGLAGIGTPGLSATPFDKYRQTYINRWFTSLGDVRFAATNPVVPSNPTGSAATVDDFGQFDYSAAAPRPTAEREYPYSWAFMIQRALQWDPEPHVPTGAGANLSVARPTRDYGTDRISVLCFYRRNVKPPSRSVRIVEGCIFNGSRKVTLSWPASNRRPEIKKGTWICEATICRDFGNQAVNRRTGFYAAPHGIPPYLSTYRRTYNFFKVVDYDEPEIGVGASAGRIFQKVTIDRTPSGYPNAHPLGDLRATDGFADNYAVQQRVYRNPAWPLRSGGSGPTAWQANFADRGNVGLGLTEPPEAIFYPILIFDGLVEVY